MNIKMTIYEGNNTINVTDYTPTVTLTVVENLYQSSRGGAVNSVNGKTGTVVLGANDINESSNRFWLTDVLKTDYDGAVSGLANKVDKVTGKGLSENDFTNVLKSAYDSAVTWISTNGSNLINHLSNTSNPHNTTASQLGLGNVDNTSDANKPISTATQTALDLKSNKTEVSIVLFKSITQTIVTGKIAETSIYSIPLPTDGGDYIIRIYSQAQLTTLVGAQPTHRLRVGIYNNPIDGVTGVNAIGNQTLLAQNTMNSAGNSYPITRNYSFYGGSSGSIFGIATNSLATDEVNAVSYITLASKDFTTQHYLYVSFNPSNVGAVVQHNQILVTATKV